MLFVNIFPARWKYLKDNKHENYFIVSIVGHKEWLSSPQIQRLLEIQDCSWRAVEIVISETPWNRLTVNDVLFSLKGFSSCRLTVDVNSIATSYCKVKEYAECFVSCDQGALVNGCDFHLCGMNRIDRLKLFWKQARLLTISPLAETAHAKHW